MKCNAGIKFAVFQQGEKFAALILKQMKSTPPFFVITESLEQMERGMLAIITNSTNPLATSLPGMHTLLPAARQGRLMKVIPGKCCASPPETQIARTN